MCDIMPTIAEDGNSSHGDRDSQVSGEGNTVEDMLLSILDERDRLMESFQEAQEQLGYSQNRLHELEREKDCLSRQLHEKIPEVCIIGQFKCTLNKWHACFSFVQWFLFIYFYFEF